MKFCECGCGQVLKNEKCRFIHGHNGRVKSKETIEKQKRSHKLSWENKSQEEKDKIAKKISDKYKNKSKEEKDKIQEKIRQTCLEKYGTEYVRQVEEFKEKAKETCLEKYGGVSSAHSKKVQEKAKKTCLEKYGTEYVSQNEAVKEKIRQTCLEKYGSENYLSSNTGKETKRTSMISKYGVDHPSKSKELLDRRKENNIIKYGVSCPFQLDSIKDKTKNTNLDRYGVEYASRSEEVKRKIKEKILEKYGSGGPMKNPEIIKKYKETSVKNYGFEHAMKNEEYKKKILEIRIRNHGKSCYKKGGDIYQKIITTIEKKYGVEHPMKSEIIRQKVIDSTLKSCGVKYGILTDRSSEVRRSIYFDRFIKTFDYSTPMFSKDDFIKTGWSINHNRLKFTYEWKCNRCGKIYKSQSIEKCPDCYPKKISSLEIFVSNILDNNNINYIKRNRNILNNGLELDFYIPDKKIAIECNGLYWHSYELLNDKKYHLNKTIDCEEKGIRLIQIFEDEIKEKPQIVENRLLSIFGIYNKTIYARDCVVKQIINKKECYNFLENNHLQGKYNYKVAYGLYHNNKLISLMTFGSYRISCGKKPIENEYEMLRFCNKLGYHVPGSASRLLKKFILEFKPIKIISYCDRRWSNGNLYDKIGFKLDHITEPGYSYVDLNHNQSRLNRFLFTKYNTKKLFADFDNAKSVYENMINHGYCTIYDCGQRVYCMNTVFEVG